MKLNVQYVVDSEKPATPMFNLIVILLLPATCKSTYVYSYQGHSAFRTLKIDRNTNVSSNTLEGKQWQQWAIIALPRLMAGYVK